MPILKQQIDSSLNFVSFFSFIKDHSSVLFWPKQYIYIYTLLRRSSLKWNFWDFQVLGSNFVKFLMPILKQQVDSFTKFVSLFSFMEDYTSPLFYLNSHIVFSKGAHSNESVWDFWVLWSNFVKFLLPILKRQIDSSLNFVSLFSFMRDNSSVHF